MSEVLGLGRTIKIKPTVTVEKEMCPNCWHETKEWAEIKIKHGLFKRESLIVCADCCKKIVDEIWKK